MSDEHKRHAAQAALEYLPEAGIIGLGTGSTARHFIAGVGELLKKGRDYRAVATSEASRKQAAALGIPLLPDEGPWDIDVVVDGADEVDPKLDLIKGGGGCHTREKIVNQFSRLRIVVVDESKLVESLGQGWALPVEVLPFGHRSVKSQLERWGSVRLRQVQGQTFRTDSGNLIYDVSTGPIPEPAQLDEEILAIPGVVQTGLFTGRTDKVLIASESGVRERSKPS